MNKLPDDPAERLRVLQESFYHTLTNFFSGGTYNNIFLGLFSELNEKIKKANASFDTFNDRMLIANKSLQSLNENIKNADESSTKLTLALNKITKAGVIIAAISLIVAFLSVGLDYYKFFSQTHVPSQASSSPSQNP